MSNSLTHAHFITINLLVLARYTNMRSTYSSISVYGSLYGNQKEDDLKLTSIEIVKYPFQSCFLFTKRPHSRHTHAQYWLCQRQARHCKLFQLSSLSPYVVMTRFIWDYVLPSLFIIFLFVLTGTIHFRCGCSLIKNTSILSFMQNFFYWCWLDSSQFFFHCVYFRQQ